VNIAILGAGAWGSALAVSLSAAHRVRLWARTPADAQALGASRASRYLPGIAIPASVSIGSDLRDAIADADLVLVATATAGLRETATRVRAFDARPTLAWACKGFEAATALLPHQVIAQALPEATRVGALSGPSFAMEVAQALPTAVVFASGDGAFAQATAAALNSARLRIYSSDDVAGVELGGALKNVVAIAAGICDGLSLGRNARAALITRGLAEISRLGVAMGGQAETFMGLTGLGDLVLTCTGSLSRNREVGVRLAGGASLEAILAQLGHVAEGVHSARAARDRARERGIEMPITEAVCAVLFEGRPAMQAVQQLLTRDPRRE
jgi:glycerol-3-phosphate dehydrogenase (NAD(P)+)